MMRLMRFEPPAVSAALSTELAYATWFDFGDVAVEVRASSAAAARHLERVYAFFSAERHGAAPLRMFLIEDGSPVHDRLSAHLAVPRPIAGHVVMVSWFRWAFVLETATMIDYYASKLLRLGVVEAVAGDVATLHAAGVASEDSGLLLIGEAAVGKTSLTLRLIQRGFRYSADDTTPLRKRDLHCLPFPTPFIVRADERSHLPALPELRDRPPDLALLREPRWLVNRWDSVARGTFRPALLLFLGAEDRSLQDVAEMSPTEAVLELLRNTVLPLGADPLATDLSNGNLDAFVRLASAARSYRLPSRDLDQTLDTVLALLGGRTYE